MVYYLDENASVSEVAQNACAYISDVVHEAQMGYMQSNYRYLVENEDEKSKGDKKEEKEMWLVRVIKRVAGAIKKAFDNFKNKLTEWKNKIKQWWKNVKDNHQKKKLERAQKRLTDAQNKLNNIQKKAEAELPNVTSAPEAQELGQSAIQDGATETNKAIEDVRLPNKDIVPPSQQKFEKVKPGMKRTQYDLEPYTGHDFSKKDVRLPNKDIVPPSQQKFEKVKPGMKRTQYDLEPYKSSDKIPHAFGRRADEQYGNTSYTPHKKSEIPDSPKDTAGATLKSTSDTEKTPIPDSPKDTAGATLKSTSGKGATLKFSNPTLDELEERKRQIILGGRDPKLLDQINKQIAKATADINEDPIERIKNDIKNTQQQYLVVRDGDFKDSAKQRSMERRLKKKLDELMAEYRAATRKQSVSASYVFEYYNMLTCIDECNMILNEIYEYNDIINESSYDDDFYDDDIFNESSYDDDFYDDDIFNESSSYDDDFYDDDIF